MSEQGYLGGPAVSGSDLRRRGIRITRDVTTIAGEVVEQSITTIVYRPDADGPLVPWTVRKLRENGGDLWFGVTGHAGRMEDLLGADRSPEGHEVIWRAYLEGGWSLEDKGTVRAEIDFGSEGLDWDLPGRHAAERGISEGILQLAAPHRTHVALLLEELGLGVLLVADTDAEHDAAYDPPFRDPEWDEDRTWITKELASREWGFVELYQVFPGARELSVETPGGYLADSALTNPALHEEKTAGLSVEARTDLSFGAYLRLLVEGAEELVSPRWII